MAEGVPASEPFGDEVVRQIARHMNEDHAQDCLTICRALGGRPDAGKARMSGLDADGIDFVATVDGTDVPVRIPWSARLTERAQVRQEVVRMTTEARQALGIAVPDGH